MTLDELQDLPGFLIRRAHQINNVLFMQLCGNDHDLTTLQFSALTAIRDTPGVDVTRLSGLIAFDRSTLGGVVERLEAKGLIERTAGEQDKRTKVLFLTSEGEALVKKMHVIAPRVEAELLRLLTPSDRKELMRLLRILVQLNSDLVPPSIRVQSRSPKGEPSTLPRAKRSSAVDQKEAPRKGRALSKR